MPSCPHATTLHVEINGINVDDKVVWAVPLTLICDQHSARNLCERGAEPQ